MRQLDRALLAAILVIAAALRVWAPWDDVFAGDRVNFLETDAWYHVRLAENQVRNFPHRVTVDPYAAPNGQYVAVAPLFDVIVSTVVVLTRGTAAPTADIERVAALAPAVIGVLAVAVVWLLARLAFDHRAGHIAGLLAAVLPGHFLDRTLVGFVDHHALEVLLSFSTLVCLVWALRVPDPGSRIPAAAGVCLGLYLLTWGSGSYFVAILTAWVVLTPLIGSATAVSSAARASAIAGAVALAIVLAFQDPALFRYNTQVAALMALPLLSLLVMFFAHRVVVALSCVAVALFAAAAVATVAAPDLVAQVLFDLSRFRPDPTRMAVLEARPLFLYTGNWTWMQPWVFFRTGFFVGVVAVAALAWTLRQSRRLDHLLIVIVTIAHYAATIGQNRFGYYLVPAAALVGGWLCARVLDWGGVPHAGDPNPQVRAWIPFQREAAVTLVVALAVAPNLLPAALTTTRTGGMAGYWSDTMRWLRTSTPEPFQSPDFYVSRYGPSNPSARYTVLNWWDQGYWLIQAAHRVPVSNPTQLGAGTSAAFYTSTDEAAAIALLDSVRARYVLADWELPFRDADAGALAGRFQSLADWSGTPTSHFYELCFSRDRESDAWQPAWIFTEAYYQTMIYRLMVLGGAAAAPANNSWVVRKRERRDESGREFCEVSGAERFATADAAKKAAATRGSEFVAVGRTPWQPAFPVPAITRLRTVHEVREPNQKPNESPMVRVFEVIDK